MKRTHGNQQKHESANPVQRYLIDRFHAQAVDYVRSVDPSCILEVGCGEGYVLAEVQRAGIGAELIGVDFSESAIESARSRVESPAELLVGDAREVRGSFTGTRPDLVMMLEVLEHLDEPEAMLDDLTKLTTSHVLLSVPREPFFRGMNLLRLKNVKDFGNDPEHVNQWSARAFIELVSGYFEVVETARPFPWTMVLARVRR